MNHAVARIDLFEQATVCSDGLTPQAADWQFSARMVTQSFNTSDIKARIIVCNSRVMKAIGLNWFDQLEPAETDE